MLEAHQLSLSIAGFQLLQDIDLQIKSGEVTAIIGPNGAGKTSLLRLLCGEIKPSSGDVTFNGLSFGQWQRKQLAKILGVLPQGSALNFPFTAREVVMMGRIPHSTGLTKDTVIVDAVLDLVGGSYLDKRPYTQMSGGEKQRVQLARVLAQIWEPNASGDDRVLILDEPTSAFDLAHQQLTLDIVKKFVQQGVAVLLVVHDLNLAASCADQLVMLNCGRLVAKGSPQAVLSTELIEQVFNVSVSVGTHPKTGAPLVIV
jgi:iron complex transport system ATP-binding protein